MASYSYVFFGTSPFAVPCLQTLLHDERFHLRGTVTQPDRPTGRHAILTPSAVKQATQITESAPLWQPERLTDPDFRSWIASVGKDCDFFLIISYGKILPSWLLDLPTHGAINIHGSLLPRWRGASPIQACLLAGDEVTGITVMRMDALLDHGPIVSQAQIPILPQETAAHLHDRLALKGSEILADILDAFLSGRLRQTEQNDAQATFCRTLSRDDGRIDWHKTAGEIERQVRAYTPWPGTWTTWQGKRLKILTARPAAHPGLSVGQFALATKRLLVGCGQSTCLELVQVQQEGGKPQSGDGLPGVLDANSLNLPSDRT